MSAKAVMESTKCNIKLLPEAVILELDNHEINIPWEAMTDFDGLLLKAICTAQQQKPVEAPTSEATP